MKGTFYLLFILPLINLPLVFPFPATKNLENVYETFSSSCTVQFFKQISSLTQLSQSKEKYAVAFYKLCFNKCVVTWTLPVSEISHNDVNNLSNITKLYEVSADQHLHLTVGIRFRPPCNVKAVSLEYESIHGLYLDLFTVIGFPPNRRGVPDYILIEYLINPTENLNKLNVYVSKSFTSKIIVVSGGSAYYVCITCDRRQPVRDDLKDLVNNNVPQNATGLLKPIMDRKSPWTIASLSKIFQPKLYKVGKWDRCNVLFTFRKTSLQKEFVENFEPFEPLGGKIIRPTECICKLMLQPMLNRSNEGSRCGIALESLLIFEKHHRDISKRHAWNSATIGSHSIGFGYILFIGDELGGIDIIAIFRSLHFVMWIGILLSFFVLNVILQWTQIIAEPWVWSMTVLLEQDTHRKTSRHNFHLIVVWLFASFLFRNAYTGSMYSNLTQRPLKRVPESLEEVIRHSGFQIMATGTPYDNILLELTESMQRFENATNDAEITYLKLLAGVKAKLGRIITTVISMLQGMRTNETVTVGTPIERRKQVSASNFALITEEGGFSDVGNAETVVAKGLFMLFGKKRVVFQNPIRDPPIFNMHYGWTMVRCGILSPLAEKMGWYYESGLESRFKRHSEILINAVYLLLANRRLEENRSWNFFTYSSLPISDVQKMSRISTSHEEELTTEATGTQENSQTVQTKMQMGSLYSFVVVWIIFVGAITISWISFLTEYLLASILGKAAIHKK